MSRRLNKNELEHEHCAFTCAILIIDDKASLVVCVRVRARRVRVCGCAMKNCLLNIILEDKVFQKRCICFFFNGNGVNRPLILQPSETVLQIYKSFNRVVTESDI